MLLVFHCCGYNGHNLGNSQVSINRTIGPTLVFQALLSLQIVFFSTHVMCVFFCTSENGMMMKFCNG